jgi:hypothetical protein
MIRSSAFSGLFLNLGIPRIYPDLIRDSFSSIQINERTTAFVILRCRRPDATPKVLENESEVEFVLQSLVGGSYEIKSHIIRRGVCLPTHDKPQLYFETMKREMEIGRFTVFDLNSSEQPLFRANSIAMIAKFEWHHHQSISPWIKEIQGTFESAEYSKLVYGSECSRFKKQQTCSIIICKTGCDASSIVSFHYGCCVFAYFFFEKDLITTTTWPEFLKYIQDFFRSVCMTFITGGDLISKLFFDTFSASGNDLRQWIQDPAQPKQCGRNLT